MSEAAIGYVRVSTEEQAKTGISLDAQEDRIRAYCAMAGLDLVEIIRDEGVSGAKPIDKRPGGPGLQGAIRRGVRHVVALKLDRMFRTALEALTTAETWERQAVALHLVDQGGTSINSGGAMGRFFFTMLAAVAEMERNMIRERTAAALAHLKAEGKRAGTVPFGFRLAGDGPELAEDPAEQAALSVLRELKAAGFSLREIAAELNRQGFTTRRGTSWRHQYVANLLKVAA